MSVESDSPDQSDVTFELKEKMNESAAEMTAGLTIDFVQDNTDADEVFGMIEKNTVTQAINALADSMETRVSLTANVVRLTLAESKLAFESLAVTIVLGFLALILLICAWLILQMLLFAILKEHFAFSSVQSLSTILILHVVLIATLCLLIQRLCQNLTFRHLRDAMAPVTPPKDPDHADSMTGLSLKKAEFEKHTPREKGSNT